MTNGTMLTDGLPRRYKAGINGVNLSPEGRDSRQARARKGSLHARIVKNCNTQNAKSVSNTKGR